MTVPNDEEAAKKTPIDLNRRQFFKRVGFIGAGAAGAAMADRFLLPAPVEAAQPNSSATPGTMQPEAESNSTGSTTSGEIPRRPLGRTGVKVSAIGLGGATLGKAKSLDEAIRIAHEAIDAGVNFMDNAWEYNDHRSEEWMGQALQGRRDKVFLMTKVCTHGRDHQVGMQQLEESLRRA